MPHAAYYRRSGIDRSWYFDCDDDAHSHDSSTSRFKSSHYLFTQANVEFPAISNSVWSDNHRTYCRCLQQFSKRWQVSEVLVAVWIGLPMLLLIDISLQIMGSICRTAIS